MPALALWTLPFLWAGATLTMRRSLDAGWSAWLALAFFVPYLNYLLMLALCLAPSARGPSRRMPVPRAYEHRLPSALLAIGAGLAVGLLMLVLAISALQRYGVAPFFGIPFGIGAFTAFLFNRRYPATAPETAEVVMMLLRGFKLYGDPRPWTPGGRMPAVLAFLNTTKYPASLSFLLMTLGPAIALVPLLERLRRWRGGSPRSAGFRSSFTCFTCCTSR